LLAVCLMPNHFHLVVSQHCARDISRWMQRLLTTHTHRHHLRHGTSGRVWQGRFKAFPIKQDDHLLTVMRYVERNASRAGLVNRAAVCSGTRGTPGGRQSPAAIWRRTLDR
jgi:putative transposase